MSMITASLRMWVDAHAFQLWIVLFACACSVPWLARSRTGCEQHTDAGEASWPRHAVVASFCAMLVFAVLASARNDPHLVGPMDRALPLVAAALHPRVLDGFAAFTSLGDPGWLAGVAMLGAAWLAVRGRWRVAVIGVLMAARMAFWSARLSSRSNAHGRNQARGSSNQDGVSQAAMQPRRSWSMAHVHGWPRAASTRATARA